MLVMFCVIALSLNYLFNQIINQTINVWVFLFFLIRFGKRGQTDYLTKEYLNEYLKYLDTNSELEANPQES